MSATKILPDPKTQPIKFGKGPRRTYRWECGWGDWPSTQSREDYKNTPATDPALRVAASMSRLLFMTTAEIESMVREHVAELEKSARKLREKGNSEDYVTDWWERAESIATFQVPAWLHRDLQRVHGQSRLTPHAAAAGLFMFSGLPDAEITRWCEYAELRTNEAKAIDDEAHAALTSILCA